MASAKKVRLSSAGEPRWTEILGNELQDYRSELEEVLEVVCDSQAFRTSPKSCEFIKHVVYRTLNGDVDELKERLIGMSLLGRDASYDTSTDAGVRVRANDVRKRLMSFSESHGAELGLSISLPAGSYVPRFFREDSFMLPDAAPHAFEEPLQPLPENTHQSLPQQPVLPLSLYQLALPTCIAAFLCIVCMRWQLAQEHSFTSFWQHVLEGDRAVLYLPPSRANDKQDLVAVQQLNEAAPLLDLAGQFHHRFTVISSPTPVDLSNGILLYVGTSASGPAQSDENAALSGNLSAVPRRFRLVDTANGRTIIDRNSPGQALSGHAALLTIVNGTQRLMYINGTDEGAIRSLVNRLCDESTFPGGLADSFQPGTMMQAVFPSGTYAKAIFDREPLAGFRAALERLP
jgi:hypothetical protein